MPGEEGFEHPPELLREIAPPREAELVDDLRGGKRGPDKVQIGGDTAKRHVELDDLPVFKKDVARLQEPFRFSQVEGRQPDRFSNPVVEPALAVDHLSDHPRRCGTADDDQDVSVSALAEMFVPRVIEGRKKSRFSRVEPGDLVEEKDDLFLGL